MSGSQDNKKNRSTAVEKLIRQSINADRDADSNKEILEILKDRSEGRTLTPIRQARLDNFEIINDDPQPTDQHGDPLPLTFANQAEASAALGVPVRILNRIRKQRHPAFLSSVHILAGLLHREIADQEQHARDILGDAEHPSDFLRDVAGATPGRTETNRPRKKKRGAKPKCTPDVIESARRAFRLHNNIETACDLIGIGRTTFYRWMERGEQQKRGRYRDFWNTVNDARARSKVILVNEIAATESWQAKAWLLERMYPEEFGRRAILEHSGPGGGAIAQEHSGEIKGGETNNSFVQIVIQEGDSWSDDDQEEAETEHADTQKQQLNQEKSEKLRMPSDTEA